MKKKYLLGIAVVGVVVTLSVGGVNVSAQAPLGASASARVAAPFADAKLDAYRTKILAEIDRRIGILNETLNRVNSSERMSPQAKSIVVSNINAVLTKLNNTRAVVLSATDIATLRAQVKVATDDYKTFVIVVPQAEILQVAQKQLQLSNQMSTISASLSSQMNASNSAAVKNITTINNLLTQINARANAVVASVGNTSGANPQRSALMQARADLQKNVADFKQVMTQIRGLLKSLNINVDNASSGGMMKNY